MPDKEKIITPENQGKGVTPTAGSKQLIAPTVNRPMATPQIIKQPKPEKQMVDKAGNPVAPPYDPTGKSFSEIMIMLNHNMLIDRIVQQQLILV
jgi:hypothetical protein